MNFLFRSIKKRQKNKNWIILLALSCLSGIVSGLAWETKYLFWLAFLGFVPLFSIAEKTLTARIFFGYSFIAILLWNILATWWIWNSTAIGAVAAIVCNSLFISSLWLGYHRSRYKYGRFIGYLTIVTFVMTFEYIHLNWSLSWPWLNLGNVFSYQPNIVQWYEYTGVSGGTLWVLIINILIFEIVLSNRSIIVSRLVLVFIFVLVPPFISYHILLERKNEIDISSGNIKIKIVQPNIDPYGEKFSSSVIDQTDKLLTLTAANIDTATKLVVWPETAIPQLVDQEKITASDIYSPIWHFLSTHPHLSILTGAETVKFYGANKETLSARLNGSGLYYDVFNSAVFMHTEKHAVVYNKSKLVPGVETLPPFLNWLAPAFEEFGGTTGGYGTSTEPVVFKSETTRTSIAPMICYESAYGEYVSDFVKKGANLIAVITNDGWWGDTNGYKQHFNFAKLRAIECRRFVIHSANTGISGVIDNLGKVQNELSWNQKGSIVSNVKLHNNLTFYTLHGDWLYEFFSIVSIGLIIFHLIHSLKIKYGTVALY